MIVFLLLPALLLLIVVFVGPLLRYAWLSFHADSVITGLIAIPNGGANWLRLLQDQRFWHQVDELHQLSPKPLATEPARLLGYLTAFC